VGSERKARAYAVEELSKVSSKGYALRILKYIRNLVLLPFAFFYINKLKSSGLSLYFHA